MEFVVVGQDCDAASCLSDVGEEEADALELVAVDFDGEVGARKVAYSDRAVLAVHDDFQDPLGKYR